MERHRIVARFGSLALSDAALSTLFQEAAVAAAAGTDIKRAKVMIYDLSADDFLVRAGVGWEEGVVGKARLPNGQRSPPGRSFLTGKPVVIEDLPHAAEFDLSDLLRRHGIVSVANVPIRTQAAQYGVLEVDSQTRRKLAPDDVDFLTGLAHLLAGAIERRNAEVAMRLAANAAAAAAAEREVLLRELQHRVGNDLMALTGVTHRELQRASPAEASGYRRVLDRIEAIISIHDRLSPDNPTEELDLRRYIQALTQNIAQHHAEVALQVHVDRTPIIIAAHRAIAIGMIINEIVMNAVKHAFPDQGAGRIDISFAHEGGAGVLVIADSGRGMAHADARGTGLALVEALVRQVGGTVRNDQPSAGGTRFTIRFELQQNDLRSGAAATPR